jgi:predicted RNA-binding protein with PUA-like domain
MRYWLMKSEPDVYPWSRLVAEGVGHWDGVRNHQAAGHLRAMALGDRAFFYHSNIGKEIVGTMEIVRTWHPDPTDPTGKWGMVDVAPLSAATRPIPLAEIKADPALAGLVFLRQSRLSVSPVDADAWRHLCAQAGIAP